MFWDEMESAYYQVFESWDGSLKKKIWMMPPSSDLERTCNIDKSRQ
jgi:hypothetical protein